MQRRAILTHEQYSKSSIEPSIDRWRRKSHSESTAKQNVYSKYVSVDIIECLLISKYNINLQQFLQRIHPQKFALHYELLDMTFLNTVLSSLNGLLFFSSRSTLLGSISESKVRVETTQHSGLSPTSHMYNYILHHSGLGTTSHMYNYILQHSGLGTTSHMYNYILQHSGLDTTSHM